MKHLKSFPIYERDYEKYNMPNMKQRAETLRDLIKGKLSPEDVINKKDFDYPGWKKKIEELKAFLSPGKFNTAQASELLYPNPKYMPAEAKFKKK
jgi:hypothetical protein